jgi:Scavenger mRNA decapping enzyme C-term binding
MHWPLFVHKKVAFRVTSHRSTWGSLATMSETSRPSSKEADMNDSSPRHSPATVLASTSIARTLTISDQHANILLELAGLEQKALLKLTLVPIHKTDLACLSKFDEDAGSLNKERMAAQQALREQEEKDHSSKVLTFLSKFQWRLTSESGAEYSFHEAVLKPDGSNDDQEGREPFQKMAKHDDSGLFKKAGVFKAELICPASDRQVNRAMPSPGLRLVNETPALYKAVTKAYIDGVVSSGSLSWIRNIVEVKKEKERLLHNAERWILNIDTKWRTHPDALTVPRSEWHQHESVADLYCLGIFKDDGVASLRDLTGDHLPILRQMLEEGSKIIETVYGVPNDQLRIFVHYQPQFYHFHVHYTRLENETGVQVEKAHLLSDIIQSLEKDPKWFQEKVLVYKLSLEDKLYKLIKAYGQLTVA